MAYGYISRRFSYDSPEPEHLDDSGVKELIDILKNAIDSEKLKDLKSALSKLKLSINDNFPIFTKEAATFGAYLYAINNDKNKSADSILKAALKKNYTYDGFPLLTLVTNLSNQDMSTLIKDYFSDTSSQWQLEGTQTIREMFKQFPKETEQFIIDGRLNKYEKGDNRVETAATVCAVGGADAILKALNTFFGMDYVLQYGIAPNKLHVLVNSVRERSKDIQKKVMQEYFYKVAIKDMHYSEVEKDFENGFLDDTMITNYTLILFKKGLQSLIEVLRNIKNISLRDSMVTSNDEILNKVIDIDSTLLSEELKELFVF